MFDREFADMVHDQMTSDDDFINEIERHMMFAEKMAEYIDLSVGNPDIPNRAYLSDYSDNLKYVVLLNMGYLMEYYLQLKSQGLENCVVLARQSNYYQRVRNSNMHMYNFVVNPHMLTFFHGGRAQTGTRARTGNQ